MICKCSTEMYYFVCKFKKFFLKILIIRGDLLGLGEGSCIKWKVLSAELSVTCYHL